MSLSPGTLILMTVRILHCADLHLDATLGDTARASQLDGISDAEQKRFTDAPLTALTNIQRAAINNRVDIVVIAGDVFNRRDGIANDLPTRSAFTRFLRALSESNIYVVIALGNHDPLSSIQELTQAWPDTVRLFSQSAPETFEFTIDGHKVLCHGMSYTSHDESRNLASMYPAADPQAINIGVLHTNVESDVNHKNYAPCTLHDLTTLAYDYMALGHVHKRTILSEHPFVAYSGNSQGLSAKPSECERKGCFIATIESPGATLTYEFIETDTVQYVREHITIDDSLATEDVASHVARELHQRFNNSDLTYICRLTLTVNGIFSNNDLLRMINDERAQVIVTSLTLTSAATKFDELSSSHVFFQLLDNELKNFSGPQLEDLYGKRAHEISLLLDSPEINNTELAEQIKEHISMVYAQESKGS